MKRIPEIRTTHDAIDWAIKQGPFNTMPEQAILLYLSTRAFVSDKNDEDAEIGTVMYYPSRIGEIMEATAIKSRTTVRNALNSLQAKGYLSRTSRGNGPVWDHSLIRLLWDEESATLRNAVREGRIEAPADWGSFLKQPQKVIRRGHLSLVV